MVKECTYCGNDFETKRTDSKYCSGSCKSQAYIARKANPGIGEIIDGDYPLDVNRRKTRQNRKTVNSSIPLSRTHLDKLLNGVKTNPQYVKYLMDEKDRIGEIKSDKSKLEIQMLFIQRDLDTANAKIAELTKENDRLNRAVEKNEESMIGKLVDFCGRHPQVMLAIAGKLGVDPMDILAGQSDVAVGGQSDPTDEKEI